jgi:hypothetical protein
MNKAFSAEAAGSRGFDALGMRKKLLWSNGRDMDFVISVVI